MTNYRCIKCELVWEEKDFSFDQFCETCNRSTHNNNERRRYGSIFSMYCQKLFYLRYPEPNHSGITIPSDDGGKAEMVKEAKRKIASGIKMRTEEKEIKEKNNNTSSQAYKDVVADIAQLEQQRSLIVNLEKKYC